MHDIPQLIWSQLLNKTVKHLVSNTLIEQSLIANTFQTFLWSIIPLLFWDILCCENFQQNSSSIGLQQQY